jgi:hypothetical protein
MQEVKAKKNVPGCYCCIVLAAWLSLRDAIKLPAEGLVCPRPTDENGSLRGKKGRCGC